MKIAIINYLDSTKPGGIAKVVIEIAKGLKSNGHQVLIIQPQSAINIDVDIRGFRRRGIFSWFGVHHLHIGDLKEIRQIIDDFEPDVINIHGSRGLLPPLLVRSMKKRNLGVPLLYTPHHDSNSGVTFSGKYLFWLYKILFLSKAYDKADKITVCSIFEEGQVSHLLRKGNEGKIVVIPNGADVCNKEENQDKSDDLRIICAGYLFELKGVQHVIRALKIIRERGMKRARLVVCGDGPYGRKLRKIAKSLNIDENIEWRGFVSRDELLEEISGSHVLALISKSENFGIVVAESLALGTPVVVANTTALSEFSWADGCEIIDFPPDYESLADLLIDSQFRTVGNEVFGKGNVLPWLDVVKMYEQEINALHHGKTRNN